MVYIRLGMRNLVRHLRRSFITVFSIGWGLAVILWIQAILNGSNHAITETVTTTYYGNMQVARVDYAKEKLLQQFFEWDPKHLPDVPGEQIMASPRVFVPALISTGEQSMPIMLEGVDPVAEAKITKLKDSLVEGEYLVNEAGNTCESHDVYVSRWLAKLFGVSMGEKVVVLAQAADGSMSNELFRVRGIFDTGSPEFDKGVIVSTTPCVQAVGKVKGVHEVAIRVTGRKTDVDKVQADLASRLPQDLTARSWREVAPQLASMIIFNDGSVILVSLMLFVVISLGIINTFLVSVFERTREFGVMMALGTPAKAVLTTLLTEALFLGVAAAIVGVIVGGAVIFYHSKVGFDITLFVGKGYSIGDFKMSLLLYPVMNWIGAAKATLSLIVVIVLSGVYPAWRASRLNPADAIRAR